MSRLCWEENGSFMWTSHDMQVWHWLCLFLCLDECLVCPLGYFCGALGLVQPSGPCAPGFLCFLRSTVPNPTDNNTGALCPPGAYCQLGVRSGTGQSVQNILHNNDSIVLKHSKETFNILKRFHNAGMTRKQTNFISVPFRRLFSRLLLWLGI